MNQEKHQRRMEILAPHLERLDREEFDIAYFAGLPVEALKQLIEEGLADPEEGQNDSPTIREFVLFMAEPPAGNIRAHGYIVHHDRNDHRVSIEGLTIEHASSSSLIEFIMWNRTADELDANASTGYARSWWD